jgi:hypothetical protein
MSRLLGALLLGAGVIGGAVAATARTGGVNEASMNDAMFAIEVNRGSIVQRIVRFFDEEIRAAGMTPEMAVEQLTALRADQLLAASLSNRFADVQDIVAEPASGGVPSHRFVAVSPAAAAGYVTPAEASLVVVRIKDKLEVAPVSALSALPADSQVVGFFSAMATGTVVARTDGVSRRMDGPGTGSGSWIGYTAGGNVASGTNSAVAAGFNNQATALGAFVAAGQNHVASGVSSLVIGGFQNAAAGLDAMVGGGAFNRANGPRSVVLSGYGNLTTGSYGIVVGGGRDTNTTNPAGSEVQDNAAYGKWSFVGGGHGNRAGVSGNEGFRNSAVVGGQRNVASGIQSFIGAGGCNVASGTSAAVAAGGQDANTGTCIFGNVASGPYSFVGGGFGNTASGTSAVVLGGGGRAADSNSFVFAGYGGSTTASPIYAPTNGAGSFNIGAPGGVHLNTDTTLRFGSQVRQNITLWGDPTSATGSYGIGVQASNMYFRLDTAVNDNGFRYYSGGVHNDAAGNAGGGTWLATLDRQGSFQLPQSLDQQIRLRTGSSLIQGMGAQNSTLYLRTNQSVAFYLYGTHNDNILDAGSGGSILATIQSGAGSATVTGNVRALAFTSTSDRESKHAFAAVDAKSILAKVAALPIMTWAYNAERDSAVRHIGPVAQDFMKAFSVGYDDKTITGVDANGVALAAIKGLNELVKEKDRQIAALTERLRAIEKRLGLK